MWAWADDWRAYFKAARAVTQRDVQDFVAQNKGAFERRVVPKLAAEHDFAPVGIGNEAIVLDGAVGHPQRDGGKAGRFGHAKARQRLQFGFCDWTWGTR